MDVFLIIWIAVGAAVGALINAALKGGKLALLSRAIVCALGGVVAGWALQSLGFEPGGAYPGAVVSAAIGAIAALPVLWFIDNS